MIREVTISGSWVRGCVFAGLLYLLLPNILFLFGWTLLPYAVTTTGGLLLVFLVLFFKNRYSAPIICSAWDILCLSITLMLCVLLVEAIGFHGQVPQTLDMVVRNPIYDTLVREPWPIAHPDGRMFVYYLAYWLPPAFLLKCGMPIDAATILSIWTFVGMALSAGILFIRLKGRVLVFFLALLLMGLGSDVLHSHAMFEDSIYPRWQMLYRETCIAFSYTETFRCVPGGWLQFINTFNHAVPVLLFFSLLFSRRVNFFGILFAAALMTAFSPLVSIVLFPLLLVLFILHLKRGFCSTCIGSLLVSAGCAALLMADAAYFTMATGSGSHPIWLDSSFQLLPPVQLCRFAVCIALCALQFILLYFVCVCRFHRSYIPWVLGIVFLMSMFIWVGMEGNNELLFKGVMVLWLYISFLVALNWRPATSWKRKVCIVMLLMFFSCTVRKDFANRVSRYTWNPTAMCQNIQDDWHGTLIHPEHFWNSRFWAKDATLPFMIKEAATPTQE